MTRRPDRHRPRSATGGRPDVVVDGTGLAGLTCAYLLAKQGMRVVVRGPDQRAGTQPSADTQRRAGAQPQAGTQPARWLVLNQVTTDLLSDLWDADEELFDDAWPLRHREVRWGPGATPTTLDQAAVVVDGAALTHRLTRRLDERHCHYDCDCHYDCHCGCGCGCVRFEAVSGPAHPPPAHVPWTILTTGRPRTQPTFAPSEPSGGGGRLVEAGRRCMISGTARFAPTATSRFADRSTCWLRTARLGWIFVAPVSTSVALVQAMVPGPVSHPRLLLTDRLTETGLSGALAGPPTTATVVDAAPRLLDPPCGPGWLAVGTLAARFDPLSGSGTAHALRTALLATAVIKAATGGEPVVALLDHYTRRIQDVFADHLRSCVRLYSEGLPDTTWQDEVDAAVSTLSRARPAQATFTLVAGRLART